MSAKRLRARNQNGSLDETKDRKSYLATWYEYVVNPVTGKSKRHHRSRILGLKSKMRKCDAERELRKIVEPLNDSTGAQQGRVTLNWFIDNKFIPVWQAGWDPGTKNTYQGDFKYYIRPYLGNVALDEIDVEMLAGFLGNLAGPQGMSESSVRRVKTVLSSVLEYAAEMEFIRRNPARSKFYRMPICRATARPTLSPETLRQLWYAVTDVRDHLIMVVGTVCALRPEELFALRWNCVGPDALVIRAKAALGRIYDWSTKSDCSFRAVPIPDGIYRRFEQWKTMSGNVQPEDLVFPSPRVGQPLWPATFLRTRIKPIVRKLGIKTPVNFQVLRRSFATENQNQLKAAQGVMGHADISTTGNVYAQHADKNGVELVRSYYDSIMASDSGRVQ